jgi:hypothetical protein
MQEYRAYILGPDGHVQSLVDIICANEEAAREQAKQLVDGHDIELWQLGQRFDGLNHIRLLRRVYMTKCG